MGNTPTLNPTALEMLLALCRASISAYLDDIVIAETMMDGHHAIYKGLTAEEEEVIATALVLYVESRQQSVTKLQQVLEED